MKPPDLKGKIKVQSPVENRVPERMRWTLAAEIIPILMTVAKLILIEIIQMSSSST